MLKGDAAEFLDESRLRQVIKRHSDFVPYPIYIGDSETPSTSKPHSGGRIRELEQDAYQEFYKQLTLDFNDPWCMSTWWWMRLSDVCPLYVPKPAKLGLFNP